MPHYVKEETIFASSNPCPFNIIIIPEKKQISMTYPTIELRPHSVKAFALTTMLTSHAKEIDTCKAYQAKKAWFLCYIL